MKISAKMKSVHERSALVERPWVDWTGREERSG
jgi:hypothetical protein